MATNTPNINLVKPAGTDNADISVLNGNSDILDTVIKSLQDLITNLQNATTPQAILNAIKTVDGVGSGLDADLLDGKNSTDFLNIPNKMSVILNNSNLNTITDSGEYYCNSPLNNPAGTDYGYLKVMSAGSLYCTQTYIDYTDINKKYARNLNNGVWSDWVKIGGGNLFTYPKSFYVATNVPGQTLFSYNGGAGRIITVNLSSTLFEFIIDGISVDYSANMPYTTQGQEQLTTVNLEFKNSCVIKSRSGLPNNAKGLIQTEKP